MFAFTKNNTENQDCRKFKQYRGVERVLGNSCLFEFTRDDNKNPDCRKFRLCYGVKRVSGSLYLLPLTKHSTDRLGKFILGHIHRSQNMEIWILGNSYETVE